MPTAIGGGVNSYSESKIEGYPVYTKTGLMITKIDPVLKE